MSGREQLNVEVHELGLDNPATMLEKTYEALRESLMLNRELIFEYIRSTRFQIYPSRQRCIWLLPDRAEAVDYWWPALAGSNRTLFRIAATGKLHRASEQHLQLWSSSLDKLKERAYKYWRGDGVADPNANTIEIIFAGQIEVLEEVSY